MFALFSMPTTYRTNFTRLLIVCSSHGNLGLSDLPAKQCAISHISELKKALEFPIITNRYIGEKLATYLSQAAVPCVLRRGELG